MNTLIYPDDAGGRERAAAAVASGGVIAFRTDTFYGLGADPFNRAALRALNELKGRENKPVLVLVSAAAAAERFVSVRPALFDHLARRHWPGALTLVVKARAEIPELLTAGTGAIGVRLPADDDVKRVVGACGGALTATSANTAGRPPARNAAEAAAYFPSGLALVVDGGETRAELPSTVLDVTGARPRLVREGVVTREALEQSLREVGLGF